MPTPNDGEERQHFISRCISYLFHKEGEKDKGHAWQKCNGIYEQWQKNKRKK